MSREQKNNIDGKMSSYREEFGWKSSLDEWEKVNVEDLRAGDTISDGGCIVIFVGVSSIPEEWRTDRFQLMYVIRPTRPGLVSSRYIEKCACVWRWKI